MAISIGDRLPDAQFRSLTAEGPKTLSTADVFDGKTVALFAVPGAFTPTCHARHLPNFLDQFEALKAKGVDLIACVSVNDMFVMDAWAKSQHTGDRILMLADGNGEFTKAVGLELDATGFGLGARSRRYAMLVRDGVVEQLNLEAGGGFEVSSADYLLQQIG
ncbi:MAG TPA: peroxiredoxin [Hyphomonadaceae bacterium]|nr:peroxiredoxin [Hyphomonadaceae bacterium]